MQRPHYTEFELEAFVGKESGGDPHLSMCSLCREKLDFLSSLNGALLEESQNPLDPRVGALIDRLSGRKILRLHPFVSQPDMSRIGARTDVVVLAAQVGTEKAGRYITVATFAEEQEQVLLRVVHDREKRNYSLYLLTKTPETAHHVRLIISVGGEAQREAVTDDMGVAVLEENPPIDWREAIVAVEHHLP